MGIRIHRMMGYGLIDVEESDGRLNHDSPLFEYELHLDEHVDAYLALLKERQLISIDTMLVKEQREGHLPGTRPYEVQSCFQWGTVDGGLEHVFCVKPLTMDDWYRYDDSMDYADQTYFSDGVDQHDDVKVSSLALWPYDSYMDSRTGERIGQGRDIYVWLRAQNSDTDYDTVVMDELARHGGFKDHAEAEAYCVPFVPDEIRSLCEFAEVFTDPETVLTLRPMIYTWWA